MRTVHFESEVGKDGVLSLHVPLGPVEANTRVLVTIQPVSQPALNQNESRSDWRQFVEETYGCCAGLGLEEPDDLPLQCRDWPEA